MKGGNQMPDAPDPAATAAAEAQYNRFDTYGPDGSGVRFGYTDGNGQFVPGIAPDGRQSAQSVVESPHQIALREMMQPASVSLGGRLIADNIDGMPGPARARDRSDVASDIFSRNFSLMEPAMEKSQRRLITNLQARGLPVGSEAFNDAYGEQLRTTQGTISRLAQDANITAGQEQSREFGLDSAQRSNAMNEIMRLMGGNFQPASGQPSGSAQPVNYSGLASQKYAADMDAYNARLQSQMGTASTLGGLGAALLLCSRDFKDIGGDANVSRIADAVRDMPAYDWTYKPDLGDADPHVGPMAEDFKDATGFGDGKTINSMDMLGVLFVALKSALTRIEELEDYLIVDRGD